MLLPNDFGYFSDNGREYVITNPDTPAPWINVLSNGDYGLVLSQTGSGYSWRTHASLNRITRWSQDLVRDDWGKYLYIRDMDNGAFWSAGWHPAGRDLEAYQVRHGFGYSIIEWQRETIHGSLTILVPLDDPCEVWLLRLENRGDKPRRLQLFTYLEWLLGAAPDWHREFHHLFIETRYDEAHHAMLATKVLWELPGEKGPHLNRNWPYVAFHSSSISPTGYDGDKAAFLGRNGRLATPRALRDGRSFNTSGRGLDAIASLQLPLEIAPGEAVEVVFTLGAVADETQALALAEKYKEPAAAHQELVNVGSFWHEMTGRLVVETPDPYLNVMANGWLVYQTIVGRLWGRSAYYQTGGAYGFRDQLQDSLVWLLLGRPEKTLEQIRLHAAHQFQEGIVLHWWHPLAESGLRSNYSDDLLWLPFVVLHYLQETGDFAILEEEMPFFDGGSASLGEHCLRAFQVALSRRSERGLPLILEGDWNDGLNATGPDGQGESIWIAHFLYYLLTRWVEMPIGEETRNHFRHEAEALREITNQHGWDQAWYWRASTDEGVRLGSAEREEGRIFLNAQTWAVLSGMAPPERAQQAMRAAREYLYTDYGALLLFPAYSKPDPDVGYLTRYAPGTRENGGVYVHASCWAVLAERKLAGAEAAYDLWRRFCPPHRAESPEIYVAEPYVMPGNVNGPHAAQPGQGGWTWYTGSAGWYLRSLVEGVLGVTAHLEGLQVMADLPKEWDGFRLQRRFRGAVYHIEVRRVRAEETPGCVVNGRSYDGDFLPLAAPGTVQTVQVLV
ncbi:MAG: glycosyl transferase family 36 [Anaerolinea sp.]|nr:glycosyl transferase family 36 [Anaerolinea sp.]